LLYDLAFVHDNEIVAELQKPIHIVIDKSCQFTSRTNLAELTVLEANTPSNQVQLARREVWAFQTPQFYVAPGDTNVFTGPEWRVSHPSR